MPQRHLRNFTLGLALAGGLTALWASPSRAIETQAREAYMIDVTTGAVLLQKNAEQSMPPASMSKIMTSVIVFERLKDGRLSLEETLPVSEKAWKKGGSKMFVKVGDQISVENLLQGVIVQSGNDACIVLAEGLSGSEDAFAETMTEKAREIGMTGSTFANATGWPDPNHRMTAKDLATLAQYVITEYPEYYHYYSQTDFTWSDIKQSNRNPLLYMNIGADGLKTGHTEEAGYGLTSSAVRDDRRLILVINGLPSNRSRSEESARLIQWGFREFDNYKLFSAGETVEDAPVWLGEEVTVPLIAADDVLVTLPRKSRDAMKVTVLYEGPIPAPIAEGTQIGSLRVEAPDFDPFEVPLVTGAAVGQLGGFGKIAAGVKHLIFGSP
ncbi:D-alanyl-D-alanine carboxypeptidase family protein [Pelagibius sp. Alg239-R121]|uniref:D-alanyl-D-alanine carboxypeptidase family protein n=1 Tax=Pelagibius sp. Alg239-R121 TaxID=2993448 RepID=UPI0024A6ABEC|nr:D-alanyl-D-alanine carboxypeptidase family protein [Pelagibius sp. Alg239-R121]